MDQDLPRHARAVVIGAGIVGCSTAYYLAKLGWTDTVLLEQYEPSAGTTWHACGAVSQVRSSTAFTRLSMDSIALYERLEAETGQATGFHRNGSMRIAKRPERLMEFERFATTSAAIGVEVEIITPERVAELVPGMRVDDLDSAAYTPKDGHGNPSDIVQALAKAARQQGATIVSGVKVTGIRRKDGVITGVETDRGVIDCEIVACCAGVWSPEVGRMVDVAIPTQACHHFYLVTEPVEGARRDGPGVRDVDNLTYILPNVGGYMCGGFEPNPIPFLEDPIPPHHEYKLYEEDWDHFEPLMKAILERLPTLETIGIRQLINGLESFTPDTLPILGESPEQENFFVCCGFNASGIGGGGGAGKALAEWIVEGEPPFDLNALDLYRFAPFYGSKAQTRVRTLEAIAEHFAFHWPYMEFAAGRPLRRSPIYERLKARGACFGQKTGWERPNWFAPEGVEPVDSGDVANPNWFPHVGEEHRACREGVVVFDVSSFGKYLVTGPDAEGLLQRLCAANVGKAPGRATYTQMLNKRGGILADLTVSRVADDAFYIVTGTGCAVRDLTHIRRNIDAGARVSVAAVTLKYGVLGVMGPKSRALLESIVEGDLSNEAFPFAHMREVYLAGAPVRMVRLSLVGELGFELHVPADYMATVYDALTEAGAAFALADAGYRAINGLRLEKGNFVYPGDLSPDVTPLETGLGFAVSFAKNADFIGRAALEAKRNEAPTQRVATVSVDDLEAILIGGETLFREGKVAGYLTSGGFGYTVAKHLGIGRVRDEGGIDEATLERADFEVEVCRRRYPARLHTKPVYDPDNARIRS
jgi:4-methylaminobutanoate oxidase (formaldehyde-forming)